MSYKMTQAEEQEIRHLYADLINYDSEDVCDEIDIFKYRDSGGDSLLHFAVLRDDFKTVNALLQAGVDPNIIGDMGNTPLHYASENHLQNMVDLFLEYGARTDIANEFGMLPTPRVF